MTDDGLPAARHAIERVLDAYRRGDFQGRLEPTGDGLDGIRRAVNALGASLGERAVADGDFEALLSQLTAMAALDFGHRISASAGPDGYRALAMGLNMLTEELEAALRSRAEAEARYRQAFVSAPIGMTMVDPNGQFIAVNPAFAEMLGRQVADFHGLSWRDVTHPDDVAASDEQSRLLLARRVPVVEIEKRYLKRDGTVMWGRVSVTVVEGDDGRPLHTLAQIVDITEQRRASEELREARDRALQSDRLKTEFLRNISHEIRTPMTSILGMTDLVLGAEVPKPQREYLEIVRTSGLALLSLVDDLLYLSRIEAGHSDPDLDHVDLRAAIEEVVAPFLSQALGSGLRLEVTLADDLPDLVITDRGWLAQILTNLIGNAVKFTEKGVIEVVVRRDGNDVAVAVSDTGVGVGPEKLEVIFDPFVQGDGSVARRHGGTGLGLAISRRLAELLGGSLTAVSVPGTGSTFTVRLPLVVPSPGTRPDATDGPPPRRDRPASRRRILVAEDNPDNRLLLVRTLQGAGFDVAAVQDGRQAVAKLATASFDAVLMDIQMPGMDGVEAITAIRTSGTPTSEVPIVAVTAHAGEADRREVAAVGADAFVAKPFAAETLLEALDAALARVPSEADAGGRGR